MSTSVVSVELATPFRQIVALLYSHGISGMPVLDLGRKVCGVISGADLAASRPAASTARDLMTAPALTVGPATTAEEAARVLGQYHIGRLPVIEPRTKRLLGIVTRSDLLRVHLRPDDDIRAEIENDVLARLFGLDLQAFTVHVRGGVVSLFGHLERRSIVPTLVETIRHVEGVLRVLERIDCDIDDQRPVAAIRWGGRV